jgi:hypothetical protein
MISQTDVRSDIVNPLKIETTVLYFSEGALLCLNFPRPCLHFTLKMVLDGVGGKSEPYREQNRRTRGKTCPFGSVLITSIDWPCTELESPGNKD